MTVLYVANCSRFVQDFLFRVPEVTQLFSTTIPMGGQNRVYKDTDKATLEHIVKQHVIYGIVHVSEIDRTKDFVGLCYSYDKPINVESIMQAVAHNDEVLERSGHELRKQQAAALSNTLDSNLAGSKEKLQNLEVEVLEQPKNATDNSAKMSETISVAKPGSKASQRSGRRNER